MALRKLLQSLVIDVGNGVVLPGLDCAKTALFNPMVNKVDISNCVFLVMPIFLECLNEC